jgi:hypothetical protein
MAYELGTAGIEITSWDTQTGSLFLLFLLKQNIGKDIEAETLSATELSKTLSGHALGISHIAGLIQRTSFSVTDFMRMYLKNPSHIHQPKINDQSQLQALWDYSFETLDEDRRTLLGIASFLVSENISQSFFKTDEGDELAEELEFCTDKFRLINPIPLKSSPLLMLDLHSFSDATEPLLTLALVKRDRDSRLYSCHRMVQTQFRYTLKPHERQQAFNNAVALVYHAFPKQSDGTNKNQLYKQWIQGNRCLQHVLSLKDHFREQYRFSKRFKASPQLCELLKDCQRYVRVSHMRASFTKVHQLSV